MNDELAGQLTSGWQLPAYAQDQIWLETDAGTARCEGSNGLFELVAPARVLTVRWGEAGPPLTQVRWQPDTLAWDGNVRVGGLVEAIHNTELDGVPFPIAIVWLSAQPLLATTQALPNSMDRGAKPELPRYETGVDDDFEPLPLTLLTPDESILFSAAHDSLLSGVPLHVYGRLADENEGWHEHIALPIVWEAVTLFAP